MQPPAASASRSTACVNEGTRSRSTSTSNTSRAVGISVPLFPEPGVILAPGSLSNRFTVDFGLRL